MEGMCPARSFTSFSLLLLLYVLISAAGQGANDSSEAAKGDQFGGMEVRGGDATGFFHVERKNGRSILVTPEGHAFWTIRADVIGPGDGGKIARNTMMTKYDGKQFAFADHALEQLRTWGFNTVGVYSSNYALPVLTNSRKTAAQTKMPFIRLLNVSRLSTLPDGMWAPQPVKTLLAGAVDADVYKGWPGNVPDVFDPNFEIAARNIAGELSKAVNRRPRFTKKGPHGGLPHPSLADEPWLLATSPDDADFVFGIGGAGPEFPGVDNSISPHLGWVVAVTKPTQTETEGLGKAFRRKGTTVLYPDPIVYAKRAWQEFLEKRYGTIRALNAAWGASYTTFDSDGGWPTGRGVMDESGRNPWIGSDFKALSTANPKAAADLDTFLEIFADRYFKVVTDAIRAATPKQLVLSPISLNGHKGLTRRQVLRAAGRYCDIVDVHFSPERPELLGITYAETHRPMFATIGLKANADSDLYAFPAAGPNSVSSQTERAAEYKRELDFLLTYRAPDRTYPIVGIDWWEYMDNWGEKSNFGLVSMRDNAYDGKQAIRAKGTDAWGMQTGGEDRDYGDFITSLQQTNLNLLEQLRRELEPSRENAVPGAK